MWEAGSKPHALHASLDQHALKSGPYLPSPRALSQTAVAESSKTLDTVSLRVSYAEDEESDDFSQRANSRAATPLKDWQSQQLQLLSHPSCSTGGVPDTNAVVIRAAKRAASALWPIESNGIMKLRCARQHKRQTWS